ncbi:site-2 protease family protein, partial [Candidatus Gracilibacteria bacterium]|nr:site-2 protease family protein [Candidatus Gracilibacteria bacterium]
SETQIGVQVGENGLIGIGLSPISTYANNDLDLYSVDVVSSVIRIKDVTYPFYEAPVKALTESVRLGGLTIQMFVDVVKYMFTKFSVPSGVAGPVGIAQMTSVFMKEGIMSLLRFMALLSLSLAMINVIPFPALDGGRLLFIVIEMVIGRKVNPRVEAIVHTIGYALLMLLIVAVTYSDVMRLIFG